MMVLMVCVQMCSGMNGNRLDRPTTRVWLFLLSLVWQPPGTQTLRASMARVWVKRPFIATRV